MIEKILNELGFLETYMVHTRPSIAELFKKNERCGIYVLHFSDGTFYVGKTIDIVRRYAQHRKEHEDIDRLSFKSASNEELNVLEKNAIGIFESHFQIRNISLTSDPDVESDLNTLIPQEEQELWLDDPSAAPKYSNRIIEDAQQRYKYAKKFRIMMEDQIFVNEILPVMKKYTAKCIPEPYLTEISFWGCSCLYAKNRELRIFSRFNIYWQEVFTLGYYFDPPEPLFSWHLAKSLLFSISEEESDRRYSHYRTLLPREHYYQTGGQDQFNVSLYTSNEALQLLDDDLFVKSIKLFNLRCMRKGGMNWKYSHCIDLVDQLFS